MRQERAVLAGGCFWGMQDLIRGYDGVIATRVGYTGGDVPNATYRNHGTHAEAIEIVHNSQLKDGCWPLQHCYKGKTYFELERLGAPSRWNTLRALRVLRWWHRRPGAPGA